MVRKLRKGHYIRNHKSHTVKSPEEANCSRGEREREETTLQVTLRRGRERERERENECCRLHSGEGGGERES